MEHKFKHALYQNELDAYYRWLKVKNYSSLNTVPDYMGIVCKFLNDLDCHLSDVTQAGFELEILKYKSQSRQAQVHGALGNFFKHVLHRPDVVKFVPFATKEEKIPDTYAPEEIEMLLNAIAKTATKQYVIKHQLLILLQYDCGLRVTELTKIDLAHIDLFRNLIKIVGAKGKKDRLVPFGNTTRELLDIYLREDKPARYLFHGQNGQRYTSGSIQKVNNAAKAKAGITKNGCTHILRHSFAMDLYAGGLGLEDVGLRLGHAPGSPSTQVYARMLPALMRKQPTPADKLKLNLNKSKLNLKIA